MSNRIIKFRLWDKNKEKFVTTYCSEFLELVDNDLFDYFDDENYIIQQYTGLKDKNGKAIYEGDIIKFDKQDGVYPGQDGIMEVKWPLLCGNVHLGEVVGNIFKDDELL